MTAFLPRLPAGTSHPPAGRRASPRATAPARARTIAPAAGPGTPLPPGTVLRAALIVGPYRYTLSRRWATGRLLATFVMLNPSTADAEADDPTIRRCVGFARALGCGALRVSNLYALRATRPADLWGADDPVGPDNDAWLTTCAAVAEATGGPLVAAWGQHARPDRVRAVLRLPGMHRLSAYGVTRAGHPRHPLYLPAAAELQPWPPTLREVPA